MKERRDMMHRFFLIIFLSVFSYSLAMESQTRERLMRDLAEWAEESRQRLICLLAQKSHVLHQLSEQSAALSQLLQEKPQAYDSDLIIPTALDIPDCQISLLDREIMVWQSRYHQTRQPFLVSKYGFEPSDEALCQAHQIFLATRVRDRYLAENT